MNERINFNLSKMAASELFEAIVALQHDTKYPHIQRENVELQFINLARELGFAVYPLSIAEPASTPAGVRIDG